MHEFSARTASAAASAVASWLVRTAAYSVPTLVVSAQGHGSMLPLALALGAVDGWYRLRVARSARSFVAEADALVIVSGSTRLRLAWANVTAIEVWRRMSRLDYVAVHYRGNAGSAVATCWEHDRRTELQAFVRRCAELVQTSTPRTTITRASLADRGVQTLLLRRLAMDLAITLLFGAVCGTISKAIWLGAATGVVSTMMATSSYLPHAHLVSKDGVWSRLGKGGELVRLDVIPRSLRAWVDCLSETVPALESSRRGGTDRASTPHNPAA